MGKFKEFLNKISLNEKKNPDKPGIKKEISVIDGLKEIAKRQNKDIQVFDNNNGDNETNFKTDVVAKVNGNKECKIEVKTNDYATVANWNCKFDGNKLIIDFKNVKKQNGVDEEDNEFAQLVTNLIYRETDSMRSFKNTLKELKDSFNDQTEQLAQKINDDDIRGLHTFIFKDVDNPKKAKIEKMVFPGFLRRIELLYDIYDKMHRNEYEYYRKQLVNFIDVKKDDKKKELIELLKQEITEFSEDHFRKLIELLNIFFDNTNQRKPRQIISKMCSLSKMYEDLLKNINEERRQHFNDPKNKGEKRGDVATLGSLFKYEKIFYTLRTKIKDHIKDGCYKPRNPSISLASDIITYNSDTFRKIVELITKYYSGYMKAQYIQIGNELFKFNGSKDILDIEDQIRTYNADDIDTISYNLCFEVIGSKREDTLESIKLTFYILTKFKKDNDKNTRKSLDIDDIERKEEKIPKIGDKVNDVSINESVNEGIKTSETESNKFESEIADNIKNFLSKQQSPYNELNVEHYSESDSKYHSDIKISNPKTNKDIWVEVKKDKYACLGGPSFRYSQGNWTCTTTDDGPLTALYIDYITEHSKKFTSFCKSFLKTDDINIPKDLTPELISAWKKSGSIEDTDNDVQFITEKIPLDGFGEKISEYYKTAKNEPVYYMQVGDELYIIDSNYNPLNIRPRTGGELKAVSEAYRIGRIQFRAKGIEKQLKGETKYYYSIVCDTKILADKENQDKEYKCSFKTEENYPIIKDTEMLKESNDNRIYAYHCTNVNPEKIKKEGFKVGRGFTQDNQFDGLYKKYLPKTPCFVSNSNAKIWDDNSKYVLKIDITGLELYPDFGHLVDLGAYYDEEDENGDILFWWEDNSNDLNEVPKLQKYLKTTDWYLNSNEFTGKMSFDMIGTACIDGKKLTPDRIEVINGSDVIKESQFSTNDNHGRIEYSIESYDSIVNMFYDSINDFRESSIRNLDQNKKIVSIDFLDTDIEFRNKGIATETMKDFMLNMNKKGFSQFILRAYPENQENSLTTDKLVEFYKKFGFKIAQETEKDGVIMIKTNGMNESLSKTTIREIPQQGIEDILDVIKNSNPRYDRSQFTKNLQDGSTNNRWLGCFDEKNELMALALVQENSPYKDMNYIGEIQSFQKGYGTVLLKEILRKFNKVWLMSNPAAGEDLKEFYRRKEFHLEEYGIPNSVYDVPVSFFYTKNIDSDKLITYLDTFFSNGDDEEIDESKKFRYSLKDKEDTYKPEKNNYKFKNKSEKYGGDDYIESFDIIERVCPNISSKYGQQNWFKGKDSLDQSKSNTYFELDDGNNTKINIGKIKMVGRGIVELFSGNSPMKTTKFTDMLIDETILGNSIIIYMNEEDQSVYCCNAMRNEGNDIVLEMEWSDVTDYKQLVSEEEIGGNKSSKQPSKGVKIWIDDIRPVPEGYIGIKSVNEFIDYIEKHGYGGISLIDTDHDAGDYQKDGGDYINCFDYLRSIEAKNLTIHIHSANPVGANHIRQIISRCKEAGWKEIRNT